MEHNNIDQRRKRIQSSFSSNSSNNNNTKNNNRSRSSVSVTGSGIGVSPMNAKAAASSGAMKIQIPPAALLSSDSQGSKLTNVLDEFTSVMTGDHLNINNNSNSNSNSNENCPPTATTSFEHAMDVDMLVVDEEEEEEEAAVDVEEARVTSNDIVNSESSNSIASLVNIGSTANAFYSSLGLALNSLTSPITAAAAAATATTAEAAAVVVAAASAISNHLSSPTIISSSLKAITDGVGGSSSNNNKDDDDEDEDEDDDDEGEEDDDDDEYEDEEVDEQRTGPKNNKANNNSKANNINATAFRMRYRSSRSSSSSHRTKKTWSEMADTVSQARKQISCLSNMVPNNVQFRRVADDRTRCYFLATPPNAWESTLLYIDIQYPSHTPPSPPTNPIHQHHNPHYQSNTNNTNNNNSNSSSNNNQGITQIDGNIASQESRSGPEITNSASNDKTTVKRLLWSSVFQQPLSGPLSSAGVGSGSGSSGGGSGGGTGNASGGHNNGVIWSREFQLLQERKRLSTWGITSYEVHKSSGKIVFPHFDDLYQCIDNGYESGPISPTQLRTGSQWAALDPQICPHNSDLIAYISGCDIWVTHTRSGHEQRLTFAHDGRRSFADDPLSAGVPSYVMQEEFNRYHGFWWQPDTNDKYYRIVYEEVDESDVCLYTVSASHSLPGEMEEYRFPRTGTANAKSKLKMVQFLLNESQQITNISIKDLPYSLSAVVPWMEYIVRVGWTNNSKYVWFQAMDRKQQRLDVILIPIDNFCETYSSSTSSPTISTDNSWNSPYCQTISPIQVIYSQRSDIWINVHDLLHFLEINDDERTVTFIWASEETGHRHLYLITANLQSINAATITTDKMSSSTSNDANHPNSVDDTRVQIEVDTLPTATDTRIPMECANHSSYSMNDVVGGGGGSSSGGVDGEVGNGGTLEPRIISKVALTSGDWEVLGRNIWVDTSRQFVYFMGLRETPLEKHLYVVSWRHPHNVRRLTIPGYSHVVELDESFEYMFQVYCSIHQLPSSRIMHISHASSAKESDVDAIQLKAIGYLIEGEYPDPQYCPKIYLPRLPSGEILYAMVFKPHNFRKGVKYPAVLNVYGGPEVQIVKNTFKGKHYLRMHMMASQGYCVICIDSRGSRHRGTQFEGYIRGRMGQVEMRDQVDALKQICSELGYVDMNRIAIHGWSYGGYLSLMGLVHYPSVFKMAIAGAPVTNWEYYDTGYTERYMDLPQNNKFGYFAGSVLNHVHLFPDEENRLLLIHGLVDENVHFYHTSQLINALNKANKPYVLHIFPDERHSLRNLESSKNYETKLLSFLQNL